MGRILTQASSVTCPDRPPGSPPGALLGGVVQTEGSVLLRVLQRGVLVAQGVALKQVLRCPLTDPSKQCRTVGPVTGGFATRLTVAGSPVLMDEGFAATTTPLNKSLQVAANQDKLTAA